MLLSRSPSTQHHFLLVSVLVTPCRDSLTVTICTPGLSPGNLDLTGPKQVFKADHNPWVTPIADQFQLGISHVFEYVRSETYK